MSTSTESNTRRKTREKIVASAKELFLRRGVIDLSMQEIADASPTTRTTLYEYYSNKNKLLLDVVYECLLDLYGFELPTPAYLNGFEQIRLFVQTLFDRFLAKREIMRLLLAYYQINPAGSTDESDEGDIQTKVVEQQKGYFVFEILKTGVQDGSITATQTEAKFRVVMEHVLALGYRYAIREDGYIGWEGAVDGTILRQSIDAVLEILRP